MNKLRVRKWYAHNLLLGDVMEANLAI
jgi:hypothetical protein